MMRRAAPFLLVASAAGATMFDDLPLYEFKKPERKRRSAQPGFNIAHPGRSRDQCLLSVGANTALIEVECEAEDGQLWVYEERTRQLHLASDVSLCLDVFGPHAGNKLGTYFCHGKRARRMSCRLRASKPRVPVTCTTRSRLRLDARRRCEPEISAHGHRATHLR